MGKELGIESTAVVEMLKKLDKNRGRIIKPKPPNVRKIVADPHYKAGGF